MKFKKNYLGKEMILELQKSLNQDSLFTKNHVKYDCKLNVCNKNMYFTYQYNPDYTKPSFNDVVNCLLLDASSYDCCRDIDDFAAMFGYEKVSELIKTYEACKKTSEDLHRLFTEEELYQLSEIFDKAGV